ncbi:MAG: flagellar biosynthetic protein FliO [Terracidiphilus sp.]
MKSKMREAEPSAWTEGGWVGWLFGRLRRSTKSKPRLTLLERITLAPRQSLALVEAEGRTLLVATSPEAAPAFYALDGGCRKNANACRFSASIPFEGYVC